MKWIFSRLFLTCALAAAACGTKPTAATTQAAAAAAAPAPAVAAPAPQPPPAQMANAPAAPAAVAPMPLPPQQPIAGSPAAPAASSAGILPNVQTTDARIAVANARWGSGIKSLEFDLTYTGTNPSADCDYQMFDAGGAPSGMTGSFSLKANEKATQSINIADNVTSIRISLRP